MKKQFGGAGYTIISVNLPKSEFDRMFELMPGIDNGISVFSAVFIHIQHLQISIKVLMRFQF